METYTRRQQLTTDMDHLKVGKFFEIKDVEYIQTLRVYISQYGRKYNKKFSVKKASSKTYRCTRVE